MHSAFRLVVASSLVVAAASFVIRADTTPSSQASEIQLQLGDLLFSEGRYLDSLDAYRNSLKVEIRSEEHTSELQSRQYLVCRLLLEKKKSDSDGGVTRP